MKRENQPFFSKAECKEAIHQLASAKRLALVIGAGSSAHAGLPSWSKLIRKLVKTQLEANQIADTNTCDQLAGRIVSNWNLVQAATFARGLLADPQDQGQLAKAIARALYEGSPAQIQPGAFARHVAQLASVHGNCLVLTTNYDSTLQAALAAENNKSLNDVHVVVDDTTPSPDDEAVYHLHGHIDRNGNHRGDIILDEKDYALNGTSSWQGALLEEVLTDPETVCLFAGMGLSDPNIVRFLHYAATTASHGHYGIFVESDRPSLHILNNTEVTSGQLDDILAYGETQRLQEMGVTKIAPDYYGQVPQFLHEVALHRAWTQDNLSPHYAEAPYRYGKRLMGWHNDLREGDWGESTTLQEITGRMQRELAGARDRIAEHIPCGPGEHLAMHLWVRNPEKDKRLLELVGHSESIWVNERSQSKSSITSDPSQLAVEAFRAGVLTRRPSNSSSRWRYGLAYPIRLRKAPWYSLPVGVVTLLSSATEDETALTKLDAQQSNWIQQELVDVGICLLEPHSSEHST
jgi:hypothetical protein